MPGTVTCTLIKTPLAQPLPVVIYTDIIYLWHGKTAALLPLYHKCFALLGDGEKERAGRYHHETDRQRYVIQHGILRILLTRYLNVSNAKLSYLYNANKKPYLAGAYHQPCHFNITHSGGEILIAIGPIQLGVDIEKINTEFNYQDIASQWFSQGEVDFIDRSPNPTQAFFLLWTRKEALLKACGTGIDDNLPLMPALDGRGDLPADYANVDWLTTSFKLGDNFMASVTQISPQLGIQLNHLSENEF